MGTSLDNLGILLERMSQVELAESRGPVGEWQVMDLLKRLGGPRIAERTERGGKLSITTMSVNMSARDLAKSVGLWARTHYMKQAQVSPHQDRGWAGSAGSVWYDQRGSGLVLHFNGIAPDVDDDDDGDDDDEVEIKWRKVPR